MTLDRLTVYGGTGWHTLDGGGLPNKSPGLPKMNTDAAAAAGPLALGCTLAETLKTTTWP